MLSCKYFDLKTAYIIDVIEYQHRRLPHANIVYRLENRPLHSNKEECILFIEKYLVSTFPVLDDMFDELGAVYCNLLGEI